MPAQVKLEKVQELTEKLSRAKAVVLTDYRGLTVAQIDELRRKLEEKGAEYEVTKNTLLERSLGEKEVPSEALVGPTATLFAFDDEITPLKVLQDFIKATSLPTVKIGFLGSEQLDEFKVSQLAQLPGREALLTQLVGTLKGNQFALVGVLSGNVRKLVYALDAVAKGKST